MGANLKGAILTFVERKTKYLCAVWMSVRMPRNGSKCDTATAKDEYANDNVRQLKGVCASLQFIRARIE